MKRTLKQNKSYWKWIDLLATELNNAGYSVQTVLSKTAEISHTKDNFHQNISKVFIKALFNKDSSTDLTTKEFNLLQEEITKFLAENLGLQIDFPSMESLAMDERMTSANPN